MNVFACIIVLHLTLFPFAGMDAKYGWPWSRVSMFRIVDAPAVAQAQGMSVAQKEGNTELYGKVRCIFFRYSTFMASPATKRPKQSVAEPTHSL